MWYCLLVERKSLKITLPLVVLILFLIPIITSSLLDLEQKKKDEEAYRQFLVRQEEKRVEEEKAYLLGKFEPAERGDFVLIPKEYTTLPSPMYLRKEAWDAFLLMHAAASLDGLDLKLASATRNFDYQAGIWDKKWTGETLVGGQSLAENIPDGFERFKKILEYSAAPGTSRHHWGTDVDIYYAIPSFFETSKGKEIYNWLVLNAPEFGFCQTYDTKGSTRLAGYNEEKWHWSYLPLSKNFTERYKNLIREIDLGGPASDEASFLGAEYIVSQNIINDYVLSINPECL